MLRIGYKPAFLVAFGKLPTTLQADAKERIRLFAENPKHPSLRMHKLKGKMRKRWSFSVNYKYRIVFVFEGKSNAILLAIGDHDIYE